MEKRQKGSKLMKYCENVLTQISQDETARAGDRIAAIKLLMELETVKSPQDTQLSVILKDVPREFLN